MRDLNIKTPRISTPRLELRPLDTADLEALVEGVGNYDVARWLSSVPYPYGAQDAEAFLADSGEAESPYWGIDAGEGLIGVVSIDGELGYWLARPFWGRGYGFEAARAAVEHWFSTPSSVSVTSGYLVENERSRHVLTCLGFEPEDVVSRPARALSQDVACQKMRLTRERWREVCRFDVRTDRLRLREIERADARALVAIATPEVARMVSSIPVDFTLAAAKAYINRRRWQGLPGFMLAIDGPGGEMIGCVGCGGEPVTTMIFLDRAHWGKGYAPEAGAAFVEELFRRFPLGALHAEHFVDNPASGRVLTRLGFTRIGERTGSSEGRLEPARVVEYRLTRDAHRNPA